MLYVTYCSLISKFIHAIMFDCMWKIVCSMWALWEIASKAKQYVWRVRYGSIRIMLLIYELYRKYLCPSKTDEPILNFSASLYFCVCHVVIAFTIYICNARKKICRLAIYKLFQKQAIYTKSKIYVYNIFIHIT